MYKATRTVGRFSPGMVVEGLADERIESLLAIGAIELVVDPPPEQTSELESVKAENEMLRLRVSELEEQVAGFAPATLPDQADDKPDFAKLTVDQLREHLTASGIEFKAGALKAELVELAQGA